MKHFLLTFLFLTTVGTAQAQLERLISLGIGVGIQKGFASREGQAFIPLPNAPDINIVHLKYRGQEYPQKRSPATRLDGPGSELIAKQEELLQKYQDVMLRDSAATIATAAEWVALKNLREEIARSRPTMDTKPYAEEAAFYQAEDARRQAAKRVAR